MNDTSLEEPQEPVIEYSVDISNLPSVKHVWVDRGEVMSCEGTGHPSHRHFKVRKSRT